MNEWFIGLMSGALLGSLSGAFITITNDDLNNQKIKLIKECEQSLPRDKTCKIEMKAVINND